MCGQPDHIHDTLTEYDHETGVMRFFVKCVRCVWKRLVHEEQYVPAFDPGGSASGMDHPAMRAATLAYVRRLDRAIDRHTIAMYGGLPVVVDEDIPHGPPWIISDQSIRPVA